jgi:hypothetical protein
VVKDFEEERNNLHFRQSSAMNNWREVGNAFNHLGISMSRIRADLLNER